MNNNEIQSNQNAISELSKKIEWRQNLLALALITKDNKENFEKLIEWTELQPQKISKSLNLVFYTTPILFIAAAVTYIFTNVPLWLYIAVAFFLVNLFLLVTQLKKIKKEVIDADKIASIIKQYGLIIEQIENEKFDSAKLNLLKEKLLNKSYTASKEIKSLSSLFSNIDTIQNGVAAILFNGAFLYHIHTLNTLIKWKKEYSKELVDWLEIIGDFEALNSLANFYCNNPSFVFPSLNSTYEIALKDLGHPLITEEKRICNDVIFKENNFIILTGSNMSGKSTFLRTLGINMVLAGIGAPICASEANIHPLNVIVFMRQTDSLTDSESYFFAEIKRLKQIIDKLKSEKCFVLLDEILKGTNSDDKQTGTIEVIKKLISKNAIGAIATHDLKVCDTTNDYPTKLINKCFEVEIIANDLAFDYKLRDGVCKNKSATFLMKKMEII
uniref:MutS-related protein n=1 Tax=Flavobacterium ardleyense TaxID=2038737 RepID=UPI0036D2A852